MKVWLLARCWSVGQAPAGLVWQSVAVPVWRGWSWLVSAGVCCLLLTFAHCTTPTTQHSAATATTRGECHEGHSDISSHVLLASAVTAVTAGHRQSADSVAR